MSNINWPVRALLLSLACFFSLSCVSYREKKLRDFTEAALFGMVYDYDQKPCAGAQIIVDGRQGPRTDINGRFIIDALKKGTHQIRVLKTGYEPLEASVEFLNADQVLYLRIIGHDHLLRSAEQALQKKRLGETEELLERAAVIAPEDPVGLYLKSLLFVEREDFREAVRILQSILRLGHKEPVILLTLADIYQQHLADTKRAAASLREYLKLENDPDVRQRLEALENAEASSPKSPK
jgi:tetratricopeptide (TPR) repeat protein